MMGWIKMLLVAIFIVIPAYVLYSPLPDGYSTSSWCKIQLTSAATKAMILTSVLGSSVGIASVPDVMRHQLNLFYRLLDASDPEVQESDLVFDGVTVRLYEPVKRFEVLSGVVYFHGGGFFVGSVDTVAAATRKMCKETNSVVISVEYRLAPEALFPAAFDDCVTATKYFLANAKQFNVDPHRVAVAGDSAGGNLAAAVSLKLRDDGFQPPIKMQVLIYPLLQGLNFRLPSHIQNEHAPGATGATIAFSVDLYMNGVYDRKRIYDFLNNNHVSPDAKKMTVPYVHVSRLPSKYLVGYEKPSVETGNETMWNEMKETLLNPYFTPLVAERLDGLPLTYIYTAEYDPLRDDGFLFADRLRTSGVKVEHVNLDIGIHGSMTIPEYIPEVDEVFRGMTKFVSNNL